MKNTNGDPRWEKLQDKYLSSFTPRIVRDVHLVKETEQFLSDVNHLREGGSLFIAGAVGCGKTLYAAGLTIKSMQMSYTERKGPRNFLFVTIPELLNEIRDSFDDPNKQAYEIINKYHETDWLILDDLGVEKVTEWVLQTLYIIINNRYEYLKSTIFTSNLDGKELADKFNDTRIPSRIHGMCRIRKLGNKDLRLKSK